MTKFWLTSSLSTVALAMFLGGYYFGKKSSGVIVLDSTRKAVSYDSGSKKSHQKRAVPIRTKQGKVLTVKAPEKIMDTVRKARPGDTIRIFPGIYEETVYIDKDDIHILGVIEKGQWPILNGGGRLNDAILYSGNNIVIENLKISRYKGNGIMGQAGNNFEIRNNIIEDTGVYGIFPQLGINGLIENNVLSGIADAAIYVGMSDNIHVAHNEVFENVAGIEIENSRHAIVENNWVYNNAGGILVFVTPGLPIKTTFDVIIRHNLVTRNNHKNFGAPGSTVAGVPSGTGILVMAADDVVLEGNTITHNKVAGILISDHAHADNITIDLESEPNSDRVKILDNLLNHNGYDTLPEIKALLLAEFKQGQPEVVSVGPSQDSCIRNRHRYITVGVDGFSDCDFTDTNSTISYLLEKPAPPRIINKENQGHLTYLGVCAGCHAFSGILIGPPILEIQAMYRRNPEGMADFMAHPQKRRPSFPEMPPQDYLSKEVRLSVAKYVLALKK